MTSEPDLGSKKNAGASPTSRVSLMEPGGPEWPSIITRSGSACHLRLAWVPLCFIWPICHGAQRKAVQLRVMGAAMLCGD